MDVYLILSEGGLYLLDLSGDGNRTVKLRITIGVRGDVKIHWQSLQTFAKACWQHSSP